MNTKSISRICGVLYLATVLAYLVSNMLVKAQLVNAADLASTFKQLSRHALQYRAAVSIDFLAMVAVMALAFTLFVLLKPVNRYLALLALGWRIGEVVLQAWAKVPDYLLMQLSQSTASSSGAVTADMAALGQMLIAASTQAVWVSFVFFSLGSLANNYLFFKGRVIPVALAVFGLIATALYTASSIAALFINIPESANLALMLPLVAFELSLGFYLTIFGLKEGASG